jgi:hypothetical protein
MFSVKSLQARWQLAFVLLIVPAGVQAEAPAYVPLLTDAEAWKKLPPAEEGAGQPLPAWIRALAGSLPKTAAALLDWDHAQRVESPLPPLLRAKLRWITASTNRCAYARAYARADYIRAGGQAADLDDLPTKIEQLPEAERLALKVMRQLAEAAYSISDAQMARLVELYGEEKVAAMVLLAAYANLQDRLLLALGAAVEPNGPLPPLKIRFRKMASPPTPPKPGKDDPGRNGAKAVRQVSPPATNPPPVPERVTDPEWTSVSFEELRGKIKQQIVRRQARIRIPDASAVRANLPENLPSPDHQLRIIWHLVTYGYQPRLTAAWSGAGRAFREDSDLDSVFRTSLFWVVTRAVQCFY